MAFKDQVAALSQKEMDRKDFLKYSGSILLAALGISGLLRVILSAHQPSASARSSQDSSSYGMSPYGK